MSPTPDLIQNAIMNALSNNVEDEKEKSNYVEFIISDYELLFFAAKVERMVIKIFPSL